MKHSNPCLLAIALLLIGGGLHANAAVVFTAIESGGDVVVSGSGTLNLAAWGSSGAGFSTDNLAPDSSVLLMGTAGADVGVGFGTPANYSAPSNFGPGPAVDASSGMGDVFGIAASEILFVPGGYVSGGPLSGSMTFAGASFASLGMTPGSYVWSWGTGGEADAITLNIVPEPSALSMLALGAFATVFRRRRAPPAGCRKSP